MAVAVDAPIRPNWPAPTRVRAAVTVRGLPGASKPPFDRCNLGANCDDDPASVQANRAALAALFSLPAAPRWLRQVHGVGVLTASHANGIPDEPPVADAAVTCEAGIVLAVLTADCLPVLLCARDGSAIGVAHAGWRGLAAGVIEACVAQMRTPASELLAWLGPAIGAASYEVGEEVRAAFVDPSPAAAAAFAPTRPGHWQCDLDRLARQRLAAIGVSQVHGGGFDTFVDERFYSFRRDRTTGRFASLIWIDDGIA